MQADVKPEPDPLKTEPDPLETEPKPIDDSTEKNNQKRPEANNTKASITTTNQKKDYRAISNFGWEHIKGGPLLPFITRGSENFVACQILIEKLFKDSIKIFSPEMTRCMHFEMIPMTLSEANAFNEINIVHCDNSVVGNYVFLPNDFMVTFESVKKFVQFYQACYESIIRLNHKANNLFGFIRINGHDQVAFVWNGNQKLVPLLYFEGQSKYVDAKSINLVDPWQVGYLKFCFKIQKLGMEFQMQRSLKVVDFKDLEILFPPGTTFELYWPENINPDLLAPEMRMLAPSARYLKALSTAKETREKQARTDAALVSLHPDTVQNQFQLTHLPAQHYQVNINNQLPGSQQIVINNPPVMAHFETPNQGSSLHRTATGEIFKTTNIAQLVPPASRQRSVASASYPAPPTNLNVNLNLPNDLSITAVTRHTQVAETYSPNISHKSSQVVSRPGLPQTNSLTTLPMPLNQNLASSKQQSHVPSTSFTPQQNAYEKWLAYYTNNRRNHYTNIDYAMTTSNANSQRRDITQNMPNSSISPLRSNSRPSEIPLNPLSAPQGIPYQVSQSSKVPNALKRNVKKSAKRRAPALSHNPNTEGGIHGTADRESTVQHEIDRHLPQKIQKNSVPFFSPPKSNSSQTVQRDMFVIPQGYQPFPSATPQMYQEQFTDRSVTPVIQNVNVSVTNVMVGENIPRSHVTTCVTPVRTSRKADSENICDLDIQFTVSDNTGHR